MHSPCRPPVLLALVCAALAFACGGGHPAGSGASCKQDKDCPMGQGCVSGSCQALPCGGCQPNEACGSDGKCVAAQGATCSNHTCPPSYPCSGTVCAKPCTLDADCDKGFVCNSQIHACAECTFDSQCAGKTGATHCDASSGTCVACNINLDCTSVLGSGHYCESHTCKAGCKVDGDCNQNAGEKCDTSVTPGVCIQCKVNADCSQQAGTLACDNTNHCVQCFGGTQTAANAFCSPGTPECNLATKSCVQCLPANNESGADCGYLYNGNMDPHDATTCDPATFSCVAGCKFDSQCGCPRVAAGGAESACARFPDQEHCDPNRTTMVGVTGPTEGACVQCFNDNTHCRYKVIGSSQYNGLYGTLNGARCVSDACVEGCDTDADCPSTHPICHLSTSTSDPNNHKCVDCKCDVPGADPTWCDTTAAGTAACANDTAGNPRVCDASSLLCRKKRMGEECSKSNECGDTHDPTIGMCIPTPAFCVYHSHSGSSVGGETYCAAGAQFGRCGVPCNDFFNNYCTGTTTCPANSSCRQATNESGNANAYCVSSKCNCTAISCP